jgi:hypothetical protein
MLGRSRLFWIDAVLKLPCRGWSPAGSESYCKGWMPMARDIDYAATAVKKAIVEKFYRDELQDMEAIAGDKTIAIHHKGRVARGTRDDLLAAVRKATSYDNLWDVLASEGRCMAERPGS